MQVLNPIDVKVGACLRAMRFQIGWSVNYLATAISVTNSTILEFESGEARIEPRIMIKICRVLNVSPRDFFDWLPMEDANATATCDMAGVA